MCPASEAIYDNAPLYDYQRITRMPSGHGEQERSPVQISDGFGVHSSENFIPDVVGSVKPLYVNWFSFPASGNTFGIVERLPGAQHYIEDRHEGIVNVVVPATHQRNRFYSRSDDVARTVLEYMRRDVDNRHMPLGLRQGAGEESVLPANKPDDPIRLFADGVGGAKPEMMAVILARRLVEAVTSCVEYPDICFDDDGELSFDLRLRNGRLLMAELSIGGTIVGSLYDESDQFVEEISTEEKFIEQITD